MNVGGSGNPAGGSAGQSNYLNARDAQFMAGDHTKDLDSLRHTLQTLSDEKRGILQKLLSKYRDFAGHDTSFDDLIEHSIKELQGMGAAGNSGNEMETILAVMKAAEQDGNEDLHNLLEKVKHLTEQKRKQALGLGVLGGIIVVALLAGLGMRFLNPAGVSPGPPEVNPGPPEHNPGPPDMNPGPPNFSCTVRFLQPTSSSKIPDTGAVAFEWTSAPAATAYSLEVDRPAGTGSPWILPLKGTAKTLYMENFAAGGDYRVTVNALSATGDVLCGATFPFSKAASKQRGEKGNEDGGGGAPCISMLACP